MSARMPICGVLVSALSIFSAPSIKVTPTTFQCGIVAEGKADKLNAVFTIENTGTTELRIKDVRVSCGCTVVKFDSVVAAGKSSQLKSEVNIKGYASGPVSKSVTVISDDPKQPEIRLMIEATVRAVIDMSERYLRVTSDQPYTLLLSSEKKDLAISGVTFLSSVPQEGPAWQKDMPIKVPHQFAPTDSVRPDGYKVFKLTLSSIPETVKGQGEFVVKTNHPERGEITLRGMIER